MPVPSTPLSRPLVAVNVTVTPATGESLTTTVAVRVTGLPLVPLAGASRATELIALTEGPRVRMNGVPTTPSVDVYTVPVVAIAYGRKSDGQLSMASWTVERQFDRSASVKPASAGALATMCTVSYPLT